MQIQAADIQALAHRRIAALIDRAASHRQQAAARPGDPRNATLASMIDTLADEGASTTAAFCDVLDLAGALADSAQLTATWRATASTLHGLALECRMDSFRLWALGPAAAQHAQVAA